MLFRSVKAAVKDAGLEENIERLSEKYETKLGRKVHLDAYELSGGETRKQRVFIVYCVDYQGI